MQINDGDWHNLEVIWQNTGGVRFVLDHGIRSVVKTLNAKLQGQFVGKIQLGNFNEDSTDVDENMGFQGCIKVNLNTFFFSNIFIGIIFISKLIVILCKI